MTAPQHNFTPAAHHNVPRPDPVRIDQLSARIAKWREAGRAPEAVANRTAITDRAERTFDANVDCVTHPAFTSYAPHKRARFVSAMAALDMACAKRGRV